jgi:S-DNA-T family DNA segregation ATPase FtsK/SpoIIIE
MAQKKASPAPRKSSSKPVKPGAKAAPTGRASPGKNASAGKTRGLAPAKTAGRSASASRKPKRKILSLPFGRNKGTQKSQPSRTPRPVRQGLSLDRKLDILGIALALAGLLTLLSMLSPINGSLTGGWVAALGMTFGWGMYLFPIGLIATGLWLVLRNFERVPQLAVERLLGIVLLYLDLLAIFHFIEMLSTGQKALELARLSTGGGYVGAATGGALVTAFGYGGAAVGLACWLIIALALALDVTIGEMLRGLWAGLARFQDWLIETIQERQSERSPVYHPPSGYPEYKPPAPNQPAAQPFTPATAAAGQGSPTPQWVLPPVEQILDEGGEVNYNDELDLQRARLIEETLASFGAPARVVEINRGPTITQFGVEPDFVEMRGGRMRVRVGKIAALADDLALALSARTIRVQAPVPGRGFVGIEVPNDEIALVALRDLIESEAFKRLNSPLRIALGLNVSGNAVAADLSVMPHLLIAGATGSGKSVCVNSLICCLLANNTPDDLRLVMIDPKRVELTGYNGVPHLLAPVVVDLERVVTVLQWVLREMDMRYRKLAEAGCRNIQEYNNKLAPRGEKKLPFLVVIVDELADLMMLAPDETERTVTRLAQLARATGIHLVIATQRPSVDVVTGLIKANFPARIAFAVASGMDSRVILDQPGAERLLGRGDMLFQAPDSPAPVRLQGVFVSESEIQRLVSYWQSFAGYIQPAPSAAGGTVDALSAGVPLKQMPLWEDMEEDGDPMMKDAIDLSRQQGRASISMLQRRLRIGYTRAARIIDTMEEKGIVGPPDPGTGTREILDYGPAAPPADEN